MKRVNKKQETVFLGLGGNMGDREAYLTEAVEKIKQLPQTLLEKKSPLYETAPLVPKQDFFLNAVVQIKTFLNPQELLRQCQRIEKELHRERLIHWGPRTIDIDILLYGSHKVQQENLVIPHAEMTNRSFVLVPLLAIAPQIEIPGIGKANQLAASKGEHPQEICVYREVW